ncbi:hypothetical protein PR048_013272 [Dryococelus australis]|uniref:Uncharacterized protein n=1 Tax=Dryococelus australis TaxID=614101 RepID=A0ABQ9HRN8_9NEOP|nr:hypothetical protein PR048_013272 [Dryococelus australis]
MENVQQFSSCEQEDLCNKNFNVGFGSPATDACSMCIKLREQLKRATVTTNKTTVTTNKTTVTTNKTNIMTELRLHKLKAKTFYGMVRKLDNKVIMCSYNSQKNLILPKVPDQASYYSRQLYYYNFTICKAAKGSNKIASAIYDLLCHTMYSEDQEEVRLVSDDCGGRNKNTLVVAMLSYWLTHDAPKLITRIQSVIRISTQLVCLDVSRMFRLKGTIIRPEDYVKYSKNIELLLNMGKIRLYLTRNQARTKYLNSQHIGIFSSIKLKEFLLRDKKMAMLLLEAKNITEPIFSCIKVYA